MELNELKGKPIINVKQGEKIGYILDFDIDIEVGKVKSLLVTPNRPLFIFNTKKIAPTTILEIEWKAIELIGMDAILVKIED